MPISRICSIPSCGKPLLASGFCAGHWHRWKRHGDPYLGKPAGGHVMHFLKNVIPLYESDECHIWPFARTGGGYGQHYLNGRKRYIHRIVCEANHGPAPSPKHHVAHSCGNRACCNKRHLRWATPKENQADTLIHGTRSRGERNGQSKLTADDVAKIRTLSGSLSHRKIADLFGICNQQVGNIIRKKSWSHR